MSLPARGPRHAVALCIVEAADQLCRVSKKLICLVQRKKEGGRSKLTNLVQAKSSGGEEDRFRLSSSRTLETDVHIADGAKIIFETLLGQLRVALSPSDGARA